MANWQIAKAACKIMTMNGNACQLTGQDKVEARISNGATILAIQITVLKPLNGANKEAIENPVATSIAKKADNERKLAQELLLMVTR